MNKPKQPFKKADTKGTITKGKLHILNGQEFQEQCEREAFFHLGKLSAKFAEMEQGVENLLAYLTFQENFFARYVLENNTLEINLRQLERVNEYVEFEPDLVLKVMGHIRAVKDERNHLIHGLWRVIPSAQREGVRVNVSANKIKPPTKEQGVNKTWENITEKDYTLAQLEALIVQVADINNVLDKIYVDAKLYFTVREEERLENIVEREIKRRETCNIRGLARIVKPDEGTK